MQYGEGGVVVFSMVRVGCSMVRDGVVVFSKVRVGCSLVRVGWWYLVW